MSTCKYCNKSFDEAVFYGCDKFPCSEEGHVKIRTEGRYDIPDQVKPDNILLARQSITDAKNMLLALPGCTKFDVAGKLDVALGYLNREE